MYFGIFAVVRLRRSPLGSAGGTSDSKGQKQHKRAPSPWPSTMRMRSGDRKPLAAPTLTRPDSASSSAASPAPAPKKKAAKKLGGKKKKAADKAEDKSLEVGSEEWIAEQQRLTSLMTRMYDKPWDSARDNEEEEEEEEEEEDEDDLLAYFDHEAEEAKAAEEERRRQERIAEFKRVSSMPIKGVPSSSRSARERPAIPRAPQAAPLTAADFSPTAPKETAETSPPLSPKLDAASSASSEAEGEPEPAFDVTDAATAATTAAAAAPEIEPFCVGRRPNAFEEIEVTVEPTSKTLAAVRAGMVGSSSPRSASIPARPEGGGSSSSDEPPLTPRSMASAMAARRLANMQLRADGQPMRVRTAPTGGA